MSRALLVAASDDFLLEEAVATALAELRDALDGAEVDELAAGASPSDVALTLRSPSLFAPQRVVLVPDARGLVTAKAHPDAPDRQPTQDPQPLVELLEEGLPEGSALLLAVWCLDRPKGALVDALGADGLRWIALPAPPKPWEDVALSAEQVAVLRGVMRRAAPGVRLAGAAEALLLERLGFAPRLLAQETAKLAAATADGVVDEALVRRLVLPREGSLEVVRDAILQRRRGPLLELVAAAEAGLPVRDWQGRRVDERGFPIVLLGQVANLLTQLLWVRRQAVAAGLGDELDPRRTAAPRWYSQVFKRRLADPLLERLRGDATAPLRRPTPWNVGQLFAGAGLFADDELVAALAAAGEVEAATRGPLALAAVVRWLAAVLEERKE